MVSAKGKFGGRQNKAPPIDRLQVFGAPLPQQYYTLKKDTGENSHSPVLKLIFLSHSVKLSFELSFSVG